MRRSLQLAASIAFAVTSALAQSSPPRPERSALSKSPQLAAGSLPGALPASTKPSAVKPTGVPSKSAKSTNTTATAPKVAGTAPSEPAADEYRLPLPSVEERLNGPASRLANLASGACLTELKKKDTAEVFTRATPRSGVAVAFRFQKALETADSLAPVQMRVAPAKSPFGTLDCRQALLWLELRPVLERHHVTSLRIDSFYRPNARMGGTKKKPGKRSQHSYGLAADIVSISVTLPSASAEPRTLLLDVPADFAGMRGEEPCGPTANLHLPEGADAAQKERSYRLRNFVCELARGGYLHHILTPNHDAAHESHLHLDIKRDNRWFSVD